MMTFTLILFCLLAACGLIGSAFYSGMETGLYTINRVRLTVRSGHGDAKAQWLQKLIRKPATMLTVLLLGNNIANYVSSFGIAGLLDAAGISPIGAIAINAGALIPLLFVFGEVLPKVYANRHPLALARRMARPLRLAQQVLRPVWLPMNALGTALSRRVDSAPPEVSIEDLEHAVNVTDSEERSDEENRILSGIVNFGSKDVKQIMTPRTDVTAFAQDLSWTDLRRDLAECGFSRVPIHAEGLDQVRGILYAKDILPHRNRDAFDWTNLLRQPYFVPENRMIDDLLRDFQRLKVHLAIVVDEYGGTSGIVTLEDVIEEIVGDISDEFDDEDILYSRLDERTVVFQGKTALVDAYRILGIDGSDFEAAKGESDTLAGFMVEQMARLPKRGERITFAGVEFVAEAVDRRRILQIKVGLPEGPETPTHHAD